MISWFLFYFIFLLTRQNFSELWSWLEGAGSGVSTRCGSRHTTGDPILCGLRAAAASVSCAGAARGSTSYVLLQFLVYAGIFSPHGM